MDNSSLFIADGKHVYPFVPTQEKVKTIFDFLRNFPLSTTWNMNPKEIMQFIFDPQVILVEVGNALVMLENTIPNFQAHVGFIFPDRKVSGNEAMIGDTFYGLAKMFGLQRLYSRVPEKNRVMWRMLEKIGFLMEGRLRRSFPLPKGGFCDTFLYGILIEELENARKRKTAEPTSDSGHEPVDNVASE